MSHQSGIAPDEALKAALISAQNEKTNRLLKVTIVDETLTLSATKDTEGNWEDDWDAAILPLLDEEDPCYLIVRLDDKNDSGGFNFVFISYSPDFAPVRQKMLYASTRATLKTAFGLQNIKHECFGTVPEDINKAGYDQYVRGFNAPPALTDAEVEMAEIKKAETHANIGASTRKSMATGICFPIDDEGLQKLRQLKESSLNFVQLSLDLSGERIILDDSGNLEVDDIAKKLPEENARYQLYNYKHNHEGETINSLIFVYYCPGFKAKMKERMLYASCKAPLLEIIEKELELTLSAKMEIGEAEDLSSDEIYTTLHPPQVVAKAKFAKPKRAGRGGKRLLRK